MKRTYVLDTNVVLQNPNAVKTFDEHDVIVPMTVIGELDQMKKGTTSVSYSARAALRVLASLVEQDEVNRSVNVPLPGGGELSIDSSSIGDDSSLSPDDQNIAVAEELTKQGKPDVWLISKDTVSPQFHDLYKLAVSSKIQNCKKMPVPKMQSSSRMEGAIQ